MTGATAEPAPARVALGSWPTPLEPAPRLAAWLGFSPNALWLKRDDLTGLGAGGNKVRKLEYLCAQALARGATAVVTSGRAQSNHARLTAAAARRLGLRCHLVLGGDQPDRCRGNVALEALLGVPVRWVGDVDDETLDRCTAETAAELESEGERVEVFPLGGSSPLGARGYVDCARELSVQLPSVRHVVVALGTGGTMAGLVAALGPGRVLGVDVGATTDPKARVVRILEAMGAGADGGVLRIRSDQVGDGYGQLSAGARKAMTEAARREGVFLDPVYTAKALSGLAACARDGEIGPSEQTVFVHTGGLPGLFGHELLRELRLA